MRSRLFAAACLVLASSPLAAENASAPAVPPTAAQVQAAERALDQVAPAPAAEPAPTAARPQTDALFDAARQLFDDYAPDEIKEEYEFPSYEQWEEFAARLQRALEGGSLEELAAFEPDVRQAVSAFRMLPDYGDYADWLSERLDLIETARIAVQNSTRTPSTVTTPPATPAARPPRDAVPTETRPEPPTAAVQAEAPALPYYDVWVKRLQSRPAPARADELVPLLKVIFAAEGLPAELAWLAEVESSLNPKARSPAGARGLFQLMPVTAKSLGLSLLPFDERVHPGKNARAAARYLRKLHDRFDSWPLALAAYNAGETRVAAVLRKAQATEFSEIANALPVETRMYVPKVFATLNVREKMEPVDLAAPGQPRTLSWAPRRGPALPVASVNTGSMTAGQ